MNILNIDRKRVQIHKNTILDLFNWDKDIKMSTYIDASTSLQKHRISTLQLPSLSDRQEFLTPSIHINLNA
jgi:hypothetical protein